MSATNSPTDSDSMLGHCVGDLCSVEEFVCPGHGHFLGHATGVQFHQQHVETAGGLVAETAEIAMAFDQQLQHLGVVVDAHTSQSSVAKRSDRNRASVVRVVLLRPARSQQPSSGGQHRWHVHHGFARSDELLSEQVAEPTCGLDCPHPFRERRRPAPQLSSLLAAGSNTDLVEHMLSVVDGDHDVRRLVRIDADGDGHLECSLSR